MPDTILVVAEQREGKLNRVSLETIAGAQKIASETGWKVEAAVLGGPEVASIASEIGSRKLDRVFALESEVLASYTADGYVYALKEFVAAAQPRLVVMPHTYQVRDFAPRLANSLGKTLISDTIGHQLRSGAIVFTRQMFQGKFAADVSFTGEPPYFATFQNGAYRGDQAESGSGPAPVETKKVEIPAGTVRVRPLEIFKEAKQAVDLTQADIIVSVGRGIREQKNIEIVQKLAAALGGELAASRPICDAGWLPMDRQIGSSGQTVAPKLYVAVGISGAIQHLVGMKGSRTVVSINKDAEAPIFEIADYGIVGNLFDIVPALTEEVKKAKSGA